MSGSNVISQNFIIEKNPSTGRIFYLFEPTHEQAKNIEISKLRGSKRESFIRFGFSGRNIPRSVKELRDNEISNWKSKLLYNVDSVPPILNGSYWYDKQDNKWHYVPELGLPDKKKVSNYWYDEQSNLYYNSDGLILQPHLTESEKLKQEKLDDVNETNETLKRRKDFIYSRK